MGLWQRLRRLERETERAEAPTPEAFLAAARRETARQLQGAYERLARIPGDGPPAPHPRRDRELLTDDNPEQTEADRRTVEAWERAHGAPDTKGAADEARARLLMKRDIKGFGNGEVE